MSARGDLANAVAATIELPIVGLLIDVSHVKNIYL